MCAGSRDEGIWPTIYALMFTEQAFTETVENILRAQWYLKSHGIKYKMFTAWDIFHAGQLHVLETDTMSNVHQFLDKVYVNMETPLLADVCKWTGYLFGMIDWTQFWTYNTETIKYGGLTQWSRDKFPGEWCRHAQDMHPSDEVHESFALEVVDKLIDDD